MGKYEDGKQDLRQDFSGFTGFDGLEGAARGPGSSLALRGCAWGPESIIDNWAALSYYGEVERRRLEPVGLAALGAFLRRFLVAGRKDCSDSP